MPNQFSPDADDNSSEKKRSQQRLLLLLLLLIALFAYLYFFTGLIKPRTETAQAPAPTPAEQPAPEVMKQPLPPRPEGEAAAPAQPAAPGAAAPAATGQAKPAPARSAAPAGKPAADAAPAAKTAPPGQPAPAVQAKNGKPAAPAAPPAKEKAVKPAPPVKEARPATAAKGAKPATAAKEAKTAAAAREKKPAAAKAENRVAPKAARAQAKPAAGAYALEINGDLAESEVGPVTAKLKKAGISNVVTSKAQKGEPMHRLFLADFGDRNEAVEELERLKQVAPNAFMLKENGRYAVYAGSFLRQGKAAVEQDRLYDKGVRLMLKEATIPVAVLKLRAGSFADQASAEKAAGNLKKSGVAAKVVKVGK